MQNPVFYHVKLSLGALSWVDLGPMWAIWGPMWAIWGPQGVQGTLSWVDLGPQGVQGTLSWVDLGPMWAIWGQHGQNLEKTEDLIEPRDRATWI